MVALPPRSLHFFLITLILLLAASLRFYNLSALGFWTDEFCTLSVTNGWGLDISRLPGEGIIHPPPNYTAQIDHRPVRNIFTGLVRDDAHPPLYFLLLRGWESFFGDSETAIRSLTVAFSLAAILLLYLAVREQNTSGTALAACLIMAVAGPQIQFSQEARNYMPLVTVSLAAAVALLRIERRGWTWPRILTLFVTVLAALLTHYFSVAAIAALGMYSLLFLRGRNRVAAIGSMIAAAAVYALIWGPAIIHQLPVFSGGHQWLIDRGPHRLERAIVQLGRLPARFLIETGDSTAWNSIARYTGILLLLLPLAFLRRELRLWAIWLLLVLAMVTGTDLLQATTQLKFIRFTLLATPAAYVLIAGALPRGKLRFIPAIVAVLLAVLALPMAYLPPWKIDFRTPAQAISARMNADDGLVFIGNPDEAVPLALTFNGFAHYITKWPNSVAILQHPPDAPTLHQLQNCKSIWVISLRKDFNVTDVLPGFVASEPGGSVPFFVTLMHGQLSKS